LPDAREPKILRHFQQLAKREKSPAAIAAFKKTIRALSEASPISPAT
jgi:hypothetical protein